MIPSVQAIELSEGQVTLPLTWMTILQMKKEDHPAALKTAIQVIALDPLDPAALFRLSNCYVFEKQYISAHKYYERAVSLLPVPERAPHSTKLARLQEQAKDEKENIFRADIMTIFPLEVIINIFQHGAIMDPLFVLRPSWVCQTWRNCLIKSCPELWRSWTVTHTELKGKFWESRRAAWDKRSGNALIEVSLKDFTMEAVAKTKQTLRNDVKTIKKLDIDVRNLPVLHCLRDNFWDIKGGTIEELRVSGGRLTRSPGRWQGSPAKDLTCGIPVDIGNIRVLELHRVSFLYSPGGRYIYPDPQRRHAPTVDEPFIAQYSTLKKLTITDCEIDFVSAKSIPDGSEAVAVGYQADLVHTVLRGAPALERLDITIDWMATMPERTRYGRPIVMQVLDSAILPPPGLWPIDIIMPKLKSIAFRMPSDCDVYRHARMVARDMLPLIPELEDTTPSEVLIQTLESAEFACSPYDNAPRLEVWLAQLHNTKRLGLCNDSESPYPKPARNFDELDDRIAYRSVQTLRNHPEYCPSMTEVQLEGCLVSGKDLVEYIRLRKRTAGCADIRRLVLKGCNTLSDKAKRVLQQEVTDVSIIQEARAAKKIVKQYNDDAFEEIEPLEEE